MENHWWECFLPDKIKIIYIWPKFYSEINLLLKFAIFPKLKIYIFNEKQEQT